MPKLFFSINPWLVIFKSKWKQFGGENKIEVKLQKTFPADIVKYLGVKACICYFLSNFYKILLILSKYPINQILRIILCFRQFWDGYIININITKFFCTIKFFFCYFCLTKSQNYTIKKALSLFFI